MKRILAVAALAVLFQGCAQKPRNIPGEAFDPVAPLAIEEDDAAFVVGVRIVNPHRHDSAIKRYKDIWLRWAGLDTASGSMAAGPYYSVRAFCNILVTTNDVCDGVRYYLFRARPGTYGLELAWHDTLYLFGDVTEGSVTFRQSRKDAADVVLHQSRAVPATPRFSIQAGEVVYIGDVVMDYQRAGQVTLSREMDEAAARRTIERTGLSGRLITRTWTRDSEAVAYLARQLNERKHPLPTPNY